MSKRVCGIDNEGTKRWYNKDGKYHREDGPAIEYANGDKYWYINGKYHREDGPGIEWAKGNKSWWLNDELHREDGPAIEGDNGYRTWYLNGNELTEELFKKLTKGPVKELPLYLGLGFDDYIAKRLKS